MNKRNKKLKQSYIKSKINSEAYSSNKLSDNQNDTFSDGNNLLILPKNKMFWNVDIKSQILAISSAELLKNWILIKAIENYSMKENNKAENLQIHNQCEYSESKRPRCWVSKADQLKILKLFFHSKWTKLEISNDLMIPYSTVSRCIKNFDRDERFISGLFKTTKVDLFK